MDRDNTMINKQKAVIVGSMYYEPPNIKFPFAEYN